MQRQVSSLARRDGAALAVDLHTRPDAATATSRSRKLKAGAASTAPAEDRPRRALPPGGARRIVEARLASRQPVECLVHGLIDGHPPAGLSGLDRSRLADRGAGSSDLNIGDAAGGL